jgi:hypothetical protein
MTMRMLAVVVALSAMSGLAVHGIDPKTVDSKKLAVKTAEPKRIAPNGETTYPVSARVEMVPAGSPEKAATVKVHVRNTVTEAGRNGVAMTLMAVVLRDVRWTGEPIDKDAKKWLAPVYGATKKNPDGTVEHNTMAQRMTDLAFETGLLLPGEELTVELRAPAAATKSELGITYAIVPGNFESQILLAEPISPLGPGKVTVEYLPYSAATARARERVRGVALVKSTMEPRAKALTAHEQKLEFDLPAR